MSGPVIGFREVPKDLREWGRVLFDLNQAIRKDRTRIFADSQKFLNQISAANKQSTQSAQPLTSADTGGGTASITIASHSVQFAFGTVAYNSGSITGLANSTLYYVTANDPEYLGGAVTYVATTNANNVTAANGTYYVGKITTAAGGGGGTSGGWGGGGGGGGNPIP